MLNASILLRCCCACRALHFATAALSAPGAPPDLQLLVFAGEGGLSQLLVHPVVVAASPGGKGGAADYIHWVLGESGCKGGAAVEARVKQCKDGCEATRRGLLLRGWRIGVVGGHGVHLGGSRGRALVWLAVGCGKQKKQVFNSHCARRESSQSAKCESPAPRGRVGRIMGRGRGCCGGHQGRSSSAASREGRYCCPLHVRAAAARRHATPHRAARRSCRRHRQLPRKVRAGWGGAGGGSDGAGARPRRRQQSMPQGLQAGRAISGTAIFSP